MGSRRLPRQEALAAACLATALLIAACVGGKDGGDASPVPASATPTETATPSPTVAATPTPDTLGPRPRDVDAALGAYQRYLDTGAAACGADLKSRWSAPACYTGDVDGDGKPDTAVIVPIGGPAASSQQPAAVLVRRSGESRAFAFPTSGEADVSPAGVAVFAVRDRTGDSRAEVSYLATTCGASNCVSRVEVQSWDGTAWRDVGPGIGFDNPDRISFDATVLLVHSGVLGSAGAGPTRGSLAEFRMKGGRYTLASTIPDKPVFLVHSIADADAKFDAADFKGAISAYDAAIADTKLIDWQKESGRGDGRQRLTGYALFRIAIATAAIAGETRAAFDRASVDGKEPLFVNATEAFRRGFQEQGSVHAGCIEATRYLTLPGVPELLKALFDYGFANPRKTPQEICPL